MSSEHGQGSDYNSLQDILGVMGLESDHSPQLFKRECLPKW
jgi:hypothetical protein